MTTPGIAGIAGLLVICIGALSHISAQASASEKQAITNGTLTIAAHHAKNPCGANPCAAKNPCTAKNPCGPCAASNPCSPCCAVQPSKKLSKAEAKAAYKKLQPALAKNYEKPGIKGTGNYPNWADKVSTQPYQSSTHGNRYVHN